MKTYELSDEVVRNLLTFLDRVTATGLTESRALTEIESILVKPFIKEVPE